MLKKIAVGVVVVVLLFLAVVSTRPATYEVERSLSIPASSEIVWPLVSDLAKFPSWSPWQKLDPNVTTTFAGAPGVGQSYRWSGNDDVGEGGMTVTKVTPMTLVSEDLEFIRPFANKAVITFELSPEVGSTTRVSWSMSGNNNFMGKMMSLFMSMDAVVGKDFDEGLANLAVQAQAAAKQAAEAAAKRAADEAASAAAAAAAAAAPAPGDAAATTAPQEPD